MEAIEILNKITKLLEDIDEHEVINIQTQIELLSADHNNFKIEFTTKKKEETISVPDYPKTESAENSENDTCVVQESAAPLPECEPICKEETEAAEIKPAKKKKRQYCINCANCFEDDEKDHYSCCKDLKKNINEYTSATFCDEYYGK